MIETGSHVSLRRDRARYIPEHLRSGVFRVVYADYVMEEVLIQYLGCSEWHLVTLNDIQEELHVS